MKIMRWVLVLASAIILTVILMGSFLPPNLITPKVTAQSSSTAKIYFNDIGQGASTLIVSPTGKTLLIDGGPNGGGTNKIIPLLNTLGINTIDFTVVTHYHIDHIVGITEVLNANRVAGIAYDNGDGANVVPPNAGSTLTAYNNYKTAVNRPGVTRQQIQPGTVIDLGGGMRATCVAVGGKLQSGGSVLINTDDINGQSIALLVEYNNFDYLIAGDLTGAGTTSTARGADVESFVAQQVGDVDVIQLSHHGSTTSSNQRLLSAAKAEVAIAQIGETNTFGHPNREVVNRYLNTPTTSGSTFTGTGVPTPGTSPIFYQTQASPPTDPRTTVQGVSGAAFGNGGNGTIMLQTDGSTNYTMKSFDDNGVRISPTQHVYPIDTASNGITTDFPPTVIPTVNPPLPLATETATVMALVNDKESPISTVTLTYKLNGVSQAPVSMTLVNGMYQATIPAQADGTRVEYTVTATAGGQTSSYSDGYFSGTTPISSLKTLKANGEPLYLDYAARIQATVTAGTGIYSTGGANNDYAQDATAGINIFRTTQPTTPAIQPTTTGQVIEARGRIGMVDGVLRLELTPRFAETVSPFGITNITSATPTPVSKTIAQINANPESFEGQLVSISNVTIASGTIPTAPASADGFLTVTDGTGTFSLKVDKDTNVPGLATPSTPITLIGVLQQDDFLRPFTAMYSICPRNRTDLGAPDPGATILQIADARADMVDNTNGTPPSDFVPDLLGQQVKIRGVITSIDFRGGTGVEYYVQDQTAGVDVFSSTSDFGPFSIGDSVEVFGTVSQFNGLTEIIPSGAQTNFMLLSPGTIPAVTPQVITLSQLADSGVGESLEGQLIRVNNVSISSGTFPNTGSSGNLTISDSTGSATLRIDSDTNIDGTPTPTGTFTLTGLVSQFDSTSPFDSGYQILPRSTADIVGNAPAGITATPTSINFGATNINFSSSSTVTITNKGTSTITLTTPFTITGTDANQFSVGSPATTSLGANATTTVTVTFSPTTSGTKSAVLNITSNGGNATVSLSGTGQVSGVTPIVISEFRFRGPNGASDEFVEIYNNTDNPIDISGWKLKGSNNAGTTSTRATVAAGKTIPTRGHFLFVNSAAPAAQVALADQTYGTGITDDGGVAITMPNDTIVDQVGLNAGSAYKEGTTLTALTTNTNQGYERKPGGASGSTTDTGNNSTDFQLRTPSDPQNLASPSTPALMPGSLQFSAATYSVNENGASATITVTRTNGVSGPVTINYATSDGTAMADNDYLASSGTLTFPGGVTSQTFSVPILDDFVAEGNETINLTLSNPTGGATLGSPSSAVLTIVNVPKVGSLQFSSSTYSVNENGGSATITVSRINGSEGSVTVHYATSNGTATAASDYTAASGTLTFASGVTSQSFSVPVLDDTLAEANETVNLTLSSPTGGATLSSPSSAILTIVNSPKAGSLQFSSATYSVNENGGSATITVSRVNGSEGSVMVHYATSNGTATAASDYTAASGNLTFANGITSQSFSVPVLDDTLTEGNETVNLTLSSPTGGASLGSPSSAVLTIVNVPKAGTLQFSAATYSVNENGGNATITVSRVNGSEGSVTVNYATSDGTATAPSDYTAASGTLTFATGVTSQTFSVPITSDISDEVDETVTLTLSNPTGGATLGTPITSVLTIVDDDLPASLTINNVSQAESINTMVFTVTLTPASGKTVTVSYATSDGTATAASDYTATSGTLTFSPGTTTQTITVPITSDFSTEQNETFVIKFTNIVNATANGVQGQGTIVNDDFLEHFTVYAADTNNSRIQKSTDQGLTWVTVAGPGTTPGKFFNPRGLSSSLNDLKIFVADTGNNRIQRSTDGGATWIVIASPGTSIGSVNGPQAVAYDEALDTLYIADTLNNRIQMVTSASGVPVFSLFAGASIGTAVGQVNQPRGIAVDVNGRVYVADTGNNRIQINTTGAVGGWSVFSNATAGTTVGKMNAPKAIFVSSTDSVYVADTANNRIQKFSGGVWSVFMAPGTTPDTVNAPEGVVVTANGNVFIGDTANNRVQRKSISGSSPGVVVGAPGTGANQFNQPTGLR